MDQYEILNIIRDGSISTTYLAKCKSNRDKVVLKRIDRGKVQIWDVQREVNILSNLSKIQDVYVVKYRDFFETDDYFYIVTEYLDNYITLEDFIEIGKMTSTELDIIIGNMIKGLLFIHNQGISHRDIKPENIMIYPKTGQVKYLDFGFACDQKTFDQVSVSSGTLAFLAPEIALDDIKGTLKEFQRCDIWSLGMTLFTLVYGQDFHSALGENTSGKSIYKMVQERYQNWTRSYKSLVQMLKETKARAEIQELILRYLQISPEDRHLP